MGATVLLARAGGGVLEQLAERCAEDARYVHLRAADALADLGLGEVLAEAQTHHELLALGEAAQEALDGCGGHDGLDAGVFAAEKFGESARVAVVCLHAAVDRVPGAGLSRFDCFEQLFERAVDPRGQLACGRVAPEVVGEPVSLVLDADRALLQRAGRTDEPREVAKVPAYLALDGRHCEGAEGGAVGRVIALQRLDESDRGDLLEVIECNAIAAIEAPRDRARQRQVPRDQTVADSAVARLGIGTEIRFVGRPRACRGALRSHPGRQSSEPLISLEWGCRRISYPAVPRWVVITSDERNRRI